MIEVTPGEWEALQSLVGNVGLSIERIALLRQRLENDRARPGSPYTLLVGRPDAGIELLLRHWLGNEAEDALLEAGGRPLVIGPKPAEVQPRVGTWPVIKSIKPISGHLIVLRVARKPSVDIRAQLASLGLIEQLILVCRLMQAMHSHEHEIVEALSSLVATARAVLVWHPGEHPSDADLLEVPATTSNQLHRLGFSADCCLGASVWYAGEIAPRSDLLATPTNLLRVPPDILATGRDRMARRSLAQLLQEVAERAAAPDSPQREQRLIPPEESERLVGELENYLADLGREVERMARTRPRVTTQVVRKYVIDALHGWGAYTGIEGHWMRYVETLRPGLRAAFLAEVDAAVEALEYESLLLPSAGPNPVAPGSTKQRITVEAKRIAFGLICGLTASLLVSKVEALPMVVNILVEVAVLLLGSVLGYSFAHRLFPERTTTVTNFTKDILEMSGLHGWASFQRRLTAWFADRIRLRPVSPAEECRVLADRLGIKELIS